MAPAGQLTRTNHTVRSAPTVRTPARQPARCSGASALNAGLDTRTERPRCGAGWARRGSHVWRVAFHRLTHSRKHRDLTARSARGRVTDNAQASRQLGRAQRPVGAKQRTKHNAPSTARRTSILRTGTRSIGPIVRAGCDRVPRPDRTGPLGLAGTSVTVGDASGAITRRVEAECVGPSMGY
jgi:hypothetical protein